jgi:hypothetical protein
MARAALSGILGVVPNAQILPAAVLGGRWPGAARASTCRRRGRPQEAGRRRPRPGTTEIPVAERGLPYRLEPRPQLHHLLHHHNFLLAWVLLGCHGTPKQQKTHCRAVSLGNQREVSEILGNPVLDPETERVSSEPPLRKLASTGFWVMRLGKYTTICTTTLPGLWGMRWDLGGRQAGSIFPTLLNA